MSTALHRRPRVAPRIAPQWALLGAACVVLAGVLVAWGLRAAGDRVSVVTVVRPVSAGQELDVDDLGLVDVAYDGPVEGLVPASALSRLAGKVASIDLQPGSLMTVGMWLDTPSVPRDHERVGAVLAAGRFPSDLAPGDRATVASLDASTLLAPVTVQVLAVLPDADGAGGVSLTLAVPSTSALQVAQWAATDQIVLVSPAPGGAP